jgi:hypothetical protein
MVRLPLSSTPGAGLLAFASPTRFPPGEPLLDLPVELELRHEVALLATDLVCDGSRFAPILVCEDVGWVAVLQKMHVLERTG